MNKKNKALLVVLALLIVLVLVVFIAVLRPLITASDDEPEVPVETQEGESFGTLGKVKIYDYIERDKMQSIRVHNPSGEYAFVRDKNGEFIIEGLDDLPYNEKYFSALVSVVGNPLALVKVDSDDSGYEEYGIADSETWWEVTTLDGKVYRMTVGYMTHTAGGYYVAYEDRKAVYVLGGSLSEALELDEGGTSIDVTVLKPIEFYVSPVVMAGIDSNDFYLMDKFTLFKDGEMFMSTMIVDKEDQVNPDAIVESILTFPAEYQTSDAYLEILQQVSALAGESTVKAGVTDEDLKEYGLYEPKYMIYFEYNKNEYTIFASELQEDGTYYASSTFNPGIVAKVSSEYLGFLEEDLLYWILPSPFNYNITSIEKINVYGKTGDFEFILNHGTDSAGKATLVVEAENKLTGEVKIIKDADPVWDFRSAYRTVLYTSIEEEAPLTEAEIDKLTSDEDNCVLTFEYVMDSGTKRTLQFWQYSTRRTLLTINGEGQYYVYLDRTEKILSDFTKVWNGEVVDSHAKG